MLSYENAFNMDLSLCEIKFNILVICLILLNHIDLVVFKKD